MAAVIRVAEVPGVVGRMQVVHAPQAQEHEMPKERRVCAEAAFQDTNANMDNSTETWESAKQTKAKGLEDLQQ
jgi:hypothetical protein